MRLLRTIRSIWRRVNCPSHDFSVLEVYDQSDWEEVILFPPGSRGFPVEAQCRVTVAKVACKGCGLTEIHTITNFR